MASSRSLTLQQARARLDGSDQPRFWVGDRNGVEAILENVDCGEVTEIATSPDGRPFHLVTYGEDPTLEHRAHFNTAMAAGQPENGQSCCSSV